MADLNNLFVEMDNKFDSAMTEKIKEIIREMQNINDNHHFPLGDKCNETKIVRTKIDECLRVVNGSRGEGNEEDSRRKWDDLDKIFVLAYTIRERVEEEKYYLEDKNHSTIQYELEKYYMDNETIDTKENYDLGQSKQYLADYILKTLEILNTCAIAQGKENKHEKMKYVDKNSENYYERSKEMNKHRKEETSPKAKEEGRLDIIGEEVGKQVSSKELDTLIT